jgi:hypothetical protein
MSDTKEQLIEALRESIGQQQRFIAESKEHRSVLIVERFELLQSRILLWMLESSHEEWIQNGEVKLPELNLEDMEIAKYLKGVDDWVTQILSDGQKNCNDPNRRLVLVEDRCAAYFAQLLEFLR